MDAAPKAKKPRVAVADTNGNNSKQNAALSNAQNGNGTVPHSRPHPARMSNGLTPMIVPPNGMKMAPPTNRMEMLVSLGEERCHHKTAIYGKQNTVNPPKQLKVKKRSNNTVAGVHVSASQGNGYAKTNGEAAYFQWSRRCRFTQHLQAVQAPFSSGERPQSYNGCCTASFMCSTGLAVATNRPTNL